ncbi:MAG: efflux RND transporter periplasmic adaptor subunit [Cyclobacteriaceae bacterium]
MKKVIVIIVVILIASSFFGTGYFLYKKSERPDVVYATDTVFVTNIVKKTVATGTIIPRREVEVKSQVSGVVDKLFVLAGDTVKAGQLIARIKIIPNAVQLNNAEANLMEAKINFKNAEKELKRQKELFDEKVISELDYNQFFLDFNLRAQQLESAENNLELVREGASKRSGTVTNLVTSTVTGMVLDVPIKEGSFVTETNTFNDGTTIATVADMKEMIFEGKVDESEVGKIKEGMDLNLMIGALETENYMAKLEYISPKGVEEEGAIQFMIRAAVKLKEGQFLRAGYSANADIVLDKRDSVMAIKESSLVFENEKIFVEVETTPQKFQKREITTGLSDGINIEIVSGLEKGERFKKI